MKTVIEGKGESAVLFIIGEDGCKYSMKSEGQSALTCRLLFEQDLKGFVLSCIEKSATDEDIHSHRDAKYPLCKSGLMEWAVPFQKVLHFEHDKNCNWVLLTLMNRVSKLINQM